MRFLLLLPCAACSLVPPELPPKQPPDVAPTRVDPVAPVTQSLAIQPMYRELLPIDLRTASEVALAQAQDVLRAQNATAAAAASVRSVFGWLLPTIAPGISYEKVDGTVRATQGTLVDAAFSTVQPVVLAQWILQPGRVVHELLAARKRVVATRLHERAVRVTTLRAVAAGYHELLAAAARVGAAQVAFLAADEAARVTAAQHRHGLVLATAARAAAGAAAQREQELRETLLGFHDASIDLATTLGLDPMVTLAPVTAEVLPHTLVRTELTVDELLGFAIAQRDDLAAVREELAASEHDGGAAFWSAFGPSVAVGYQTSAVRGSAEGAPANGFHDQQRLQAGVGWQFDTSKIAALVAADVADREAQRVLTEVLLRVRGEVVLAHQVVIAAEPGVAAARQSLAAATTAGAEAAARHRAGAAPEADLLTARAVEAAARSQLVAAIARYDQAQVDLLAAIGVLDTTNLP